MTFPANYELYDEVTIDHTAIGSGGTTNQDIYFPYARCSTQAQATMRSDGGDARFTLDDGTTQLPRQVILDNSGNRVGFRLKIPTLSDTTDTLIRCYYNGTDIEPAASSTYGSDNAYDSSVTTYYDMGQSPANTAPQITDFTANTNDGTCLGSMDATDLVPGIIGDALDFDGIDDHIQCGTSLLSATQLNAAFHIRFYAKTTNNTVNLRPFGNWWFDAARDQGIWCNLNGDVNGFNAGYVSINIRSDNIVGKNIKAHTNVGAAIYDGNWHCYDMVFDTANGTAKIYFDGVA